MKHLFISVNIGSAKYYCKICYTCIELDFKEISYLVLCCDELKKVQRKSPNPSIIIPYFSSDTLYCLVFVFPFSPIHY